MQQNHHREGRFKKIELLKPRSIRLSTDAVITTSFLEQNGEFGLIIEPNVEGLDLVSWTKSNVERIGHFLLRHGAILFRNFNVSSVAQFEQWSRTISPQLLDYRERAAPRAEVSKNVYTSTEYPADQVIPLHHEMSYSHNWPAKIWFFCLQPAQSGGCTPIADDRKVFSRIPATIKETFMRKKVMYVRNYGEWLDLPWQEAFGTTVRSEVEGYCQQAKTEFEWRDRNGLRTRQIRQAVATHPKTGETVWFNHAHLFHTSNLEPALRELLVQEFSEDDLPRNAFYGDGTPIEDSVLEEIRGIYNETALTFPWQKGDVMMLDNFLVSHGREPYTGPRKILVSMAELFTNKDL